MGRKCYICKKRDHKALNCEFSIWIIPDEVIVLILQFLNIADLLEIRLTCKGIQSITNDQRIQNRAIKYINAERFHLVVARYIPGFLQRFRATLQIKFENDLSDTVFNQKAILWLVYSRPWSRSPYSLFRISYDSWSLHDNFFERERTINEDWRKQSAFRKNQLIWEAKYATLLNAKFGNKW